MNILEQARRLLEPKCIRTWRPLGHRAPESCKQTCKFRTLDIVDFVGDRLENLPTCNHPKAYRGYCPLDKGKN